MVAYVTTVYVSLCGTAVASLLKGLQFKVCMCVRDIIKRHNYPQSTEMLLNISRTLFKNLWGMDKQTDYQKLPPRTPIRMWWYKPKKNIPVRVGN
jgi:hypothetical protein